MYGLNHLKSANHLAARFAAAAAASNPAPLLRFSHAAAAAGIESAGEEANTYERKMLPPKLSRGVLKLECESSADGGVCDVYVVGAKASVESWRQVEGVVQFLKPQAVYFETCSMRDYRVTGQKVKAPTIGEMVDMVKQKQNPFRLLLKSYASKNADQLEANDDYRVAYDEAIRCGGKVVLGDRPWGITFWRYWAKISLSELFAFRINMTFPVEVSEKKDFVERANLMVRMMNKEYPVMTETYVHECDQYMSAKLLDIAREHNIVVAVVEPIHLAGIQKHWKEPVDMDQLLNKPIMTRNVMMVASIVTLLTYMIW